MKNKKTLFGLILVATLMLATTVMAKGPKGKGDGDYVTKGYDIWGYNYGANMFNGRYCDYDRVLDGSYCDVHLKMKWSDEWLTTKCGLDPVTQKMTRRGCDMSTCECDGVSQGWLTNHQSGTYEDTETGKTCHWEYFVKIVYPCMQFNGDQCIWSQYTVIQRVSTDSCDPEGRYSIRYTTPVGFGYYN